MSKDQCRKEASCSVSFRFGNDSTVVGRRSVFFPVGSKWINVVIVPTNTPFLIANSVFRSLGAVIDIANQSIQFKELGKTVPIRLTDRKLFRLDLLDLLQNHGDGGSEEIMFSSCHNQEGNQVKGQPAVIKFITPTDSHEHAPTQAAAALSEDRDACRIRQQSRLSCALLESSTKTVTGESHVVQCHGDAIRRPGRSTPTTECVREALRGRDQHGHEHDPGRTPTGGKSHSAKPMWARRLPRWPWKPDTSPGSPRRSVTAEGSNMSSCCVLCNSTWSRSRRHSLHHIRPRCGRRPKPRCLQQHRRSP